MKIYKILLVGLIFLSLSLTLSAKNITALIKTNMGDIEVELTKDLTPKTVDNFVKLANEGFYEGIYFHRVIPNFMIQGGCPNTLNKNRADDGTGNPGYKFEDETYSTIGAKKLTGKITSEQEAIRLYQEILVPYMQANGDKADSEISNIMKNIAEQQSGAPIMTKTYEYFYDKTGLPALTSKGELIASVDYGTLCMANSGPNTNGSQFFIVTKKEGAAWLNGKHTVFGKVTKGMDIVHEIEQLPRDKKDNPLAENQAIIEKVVIK
jgi:cyclophilin family peptidyl-prolyl cis-trans isomerase